MNLKLLFLLSLTFLILTHRTYAEEKEEEETEGEEEEEEEEEDDDDDDVLGGEKIKIEELYTKDDCDIRADEGDSINWKYKGTFLDGKEFDSGTFSATLGAGHVIVGVDKGMRGLCVGEKRRMTIHSDWAYGDNGYPGSIPPKATLVFDVELTNIDRPARKNKEL